MRVAFAGSHRVGKSTLVERVAEALPGYTAVAEPYELLEEDGYQPSDPPSIEDYEAQVERSILLLEGGVEPALFDRSPLDFIAYLETIGGDTEEWLPRARAALETLDLVVFVPIEEPDRIALPASEDRSFRLAVHDRLEELLAADRAVEVLTVRGDLGSRVQRVLARIDRG